MLLIGGLRYLVERQIQPFSRKCIFFRVLSNFEVSFCANPCVRSNFEGKCPKVFFKDAFLLEVLRSIQEKNGHDYLRCHFGSSWVTGSYTGCVFCLY